MKRYIPKPSPALASLQQKFEEEERELEEKREARTPHQQISVGNMPTHTPTEFDRMLDKLLREEAASGKYMGD